MLFCIKKMFASITCVKLFHSHLGTGFREELNYSNPGEENRILSQKKYPPRSFEIKWFDGNFTALWYFHGLDFVLSWKLAICMLLAVFHF